MSPSARALSPVIVIRSNPVNAQVFDQDGKFLGMTPYELPRRAAPLRVSLRAEGFRMLDLLIRETDQEQITVRLILPPHCTIEDKTKVIEVVYPMRGTLLR